MMDANTITKALGGKWFRRYGVAACPVCQPERRRTQDALHISDGATGVLVYCWKSGCTYRDIMAAGGFSPATFTPPDLSQITRRDAEQKAEAVKRAAQARALWQEARPAAGTLAETYLMSRGLTCASAPSLRFHPEVWHGPTAHRYPALVALVEGGDGFAVHRTYLRADGGGKADLDGGNKLMLGAVAGGAVRLSDGPSRLVVGEGIESTASLLCGLLDVPATAWAALSTSGLRRLRLPLQPGRLSIAQDGDPPGRAAALDLATRAAALGWKVSLLDPGDGNDFNDLLTGKAVAA